MQEACHADFQKAGTSANDRTVLCCKLETFCQGGDFYYVWHPPVSRPFPTAHTQPEALEGKGSDSQETSNVATHCYLKIMHVANNLLIFWGDFLCFFFFKSKTAKKYKN